MGKNTITLLLAIVSFVSISFGVYQKQRSDENERLAKEMMTRAAALQKEAEEQRMRAEEQRKLAQENIREAVNKGKYN